MANGIYTGGEMRRFLVVLTAALGASTAWVASAPAEHVTFASVSNAPTSHSRTRWCGLISVGDATFRIRAHNLGCPTARTLATRYMTTGNYPRGYFCAASILYCWTRGHSHWFRGYPYTPPAPPSPPQPPPPPGQPGHYKGNTSQNEDFEFDVTPNGSGVTGLITGQINQGCTPPVNIYGNRQNGGSYTVPISSDGSWTINVTYQSYVDTYPSSNHLKITAHMNGAVGTGNLELTTTFTAFGTAYSCDSGLVTWTVTRTS
jgi:hypothetical protein